MDASVVRTVGAWLAEDGTCRFRVWAPKRRSVAVEVARRPGGAVSMEAEAGGYWAITLEGVAAGDRYRFRLDGAAAYPDPASFYQPDGVHESSAVVDLHSFGWSDEGWRGVALRDLLIYELHTATFTPEGTFDGLISRLGELAELGVSAIELMPVAQFPGGRNWGYDGVHPFAVQNTYGGPAALARLVNACHEHKLAVILDVVYNHLGPEGNYLAQFGPYFTDRYKTPWGEAVNFDDAWSDQVRAYFIQNALHWLEWFHIDGLRLDAIHGIFDASAKHFLTELTEAVECSEPFSRWRRHVIAESDLHDNRVIAPRDKAGLGFHAQWNDDFHHAVHTLLTGERAGYYEDFGRLEDLEKAITEGFVYDWRYAPSRLRHHGSSSAEAAGEQLVVCTQNHDQVGNRMLGERLCHLTSFAGAKLAAGVLMTAPAVPLLFMGEEHAESAPFLYFTSHGDPALGEAVTKGRREEFAGFAWDRPPPDPQEPETFERSRIDWAARFEDEHRYMLGYYRQLIRLRRREPALAVPDKGALRTWRAPAGRVLLVERGGSGADLIVVLNFDEAETTIACPLLQRPGERLIDSGERLWGGSGDIMPERLVANSQAVRIPPLCFAVYRCEGRG